MTFGLTPNGFNTPRLADIKQQLEDAFIAQFGEVNTDPQSVVGQLIGLFAKTYADIWENMEDVYFSQYPNSASGVSLDNVVQLNGISRIPASQTSVTATCSGLEGTTIPIGAIAQISETGQSFFANLGGIISASNADTVIVDIVALATQAYFVNLNNILFTSSLPVITFSNSGAIFNSGDSIVVTINGVAQPAVVYATSSNATLSAVAAQIQLYDSSLACTAVATNPNIITITPNSGYNVTINSISITNSPPSTASFAITFLAPGSNNDLTAAIVALLNVGTPPWLAVDNMNGSFTVNALNPAIPFSSSTGSNLTISYQASPINFLSENFGPIPCPIGSLNTIITPIFGWNTVNNLVAGVTGTLMETDAQLRIRRANSIKLLGAGTVESIEAGILQNVPGVTSAVVFENVTLQQLPISIVFPLPFTSGDIITITYNTSSTVSATFTTDQATTMGLLVTQLETIPQVSSASYGGAGNQTLTVNMIQAVDLTINSAVAPTSDQDAIISGGRPPKSFEAVVEGGTDYAVADEIWLKKPAGIQTYGNVNNGMGIQIIDSQGNTQVIFFSRPTPIYIWVQVPLTLNTQETFPPNGISLVSEAILNYGNSLGVGVDVFLQRVLSQIFTVQGVAHGNMELAFTLEPTNTPTFSYSDIVISDAQIALFDLSRINVSVL
jgi:hypothetical protein